MIDWNEISQKSNGGTELMARRLERDVPSDILKEFQIIPSRVRDLDETKLRILYCHDLPTDPESQHLKNRGWEKFHRIVFVSYWQRERYVQQYGIPYSHTAVIQNAIEPIEVVQKDQSKTRLIYHTTPHRGLEILVPVFEKLLEKHQNIHLDVFSSFEIYGWGGRDEAYRPLFDKIKNNEHMTYHGYQPRDVVMKALAESHIFAYPSVWSETSCMSLMEAMSAKCMCVHSDLAALPETAANWTIMYPYHEEPNYHASILYHMLNEAILTSQNTNQLEDLKICGQKSYCDLFYNWEIRKTYWIAFLKALVDSNPSREITKTQLFSYNA